MWELALQGHSDAEFVHYVCAGLRFGFRVGFNHRRTLRGANSNMMPAIQHPEPIAEYIEKELQRSRMLGPFPVGGRQQSAIQISRFGVIPKGHYEGKWRLITYQTGHSINDGINPSLYSFHYTTVEIVASEAAALGLGALIAKVDIESAYRLVPVHPDNRSLLGLRLGDKLYIDPMLCERALSTLVSNCMELGIPLATHKTEGPATSINFLDIVIDTEVGELWLPADKLAHLRSLVADWGGKEGVQQKGVGVTSGPPKSRVQGLRPGWSFLRRMIALLQQYSNKYHPIRMNHGFRSNLHWWASFAAQWNGTLYIATGVQVRFATDASGNWGCGAWHQRSWFQWKWDDVTRQLAIAVKELLLIILATLVWRRSWYG